MATTTYLALLDDKLTEVTGSLQRILANTLFLFQLYKKYHWHLQGEDFYQLHKLFDKHAAQQLEIADQVAERLRTLGSAAHGMPADVTAHTSLTEPDETEGNAQAMLRNLLLTHEAYLKEVRKAVRLADKAEDEGTNDLLASDILRVHELQVWFLRSSLQK